MFACVRSITLLAVRRAAVPATGSRRQVLTPCVRVIRALRQVRIGMVVLGPYRHGVRVIRAWHLNHGIALGPYGHGVRAIWARR